MKLTFCLLVVGCQHMLYTGAKLMITISKYDAQGSSTGLHICGPKFWHPFACRSHDDHDDGIKRKHFPSYWTFVQRIQRSPVNSPHKGQWRGALIFFICASTNGGVHNRDAGDLRSAGAVLIKDSVYVSLTGLHYFQWPMKSRDTSQHFEYSLSRQHRQENIISFCSYVNKIHIFECMGKIFCVEFQRYPLKFHTKFLTHTLKDKIFMQHWNFKYS